MVNSRVGETIKNNQGLSMTIIEYKNSHNITIKFEDNTILYKKLYGDFKKGMIANPNHEPLRIQKQKEKAKNRRAQFGKSVEINGVVESYVDGDNITIRFSDNSTKLGSKYSVEHGLINPDGIGNSRTKYYNGYKLNGVAFRLDDNIDTYYYCNKDEKDMILRPCDMV